MKCSPGALRSLADEAAAGWMRWEYMTHQVFAAKLRGMADDLEKRETEATATLDVMEAEVREIEADDRYPHKHEDIATVVVNAPLALVQLEMRTRRATLLRYVAKLRGKK